MRILYIIALGVFLQSCGSFFSTFYTPDPCDNEKQYKGKLKPKDFDPHKSKRPDM